MKEVVIWLAGLLSCDGHVSKRKDGSLTFKITSRELDWLRQIKKRLAKVGIESRFQMHSEGYYNLYICKPFDLRNLLLKYAKPYMMTRKLKLIAKPYPSKHNFSIEERQIIEKEFIAGRSIRQIAEKIGRSHTGVAKYLKRQGILKP